jgi:hypothetical protein
MAARYFALISGAIYVLIGILGFIPGLVAAPGTAPDLVVNANYGYLMGLFPINLLHNIVHLAVGVWGLASYRSYSGARTYGRGLAIFYGLLAVMGLIPVLNTTFGLIPIFSHDVWLHALTALIAAYFGFKSTPDAATVGSSNRATVAGRDRY